MSKPTVAFMPEAGAWGPTNNCVALAEVLRDHGLRVVFVLEESFHGALEAKGFEEALVQVAEPADGGGDVWSEYIRATAPEFRKPTIEQIATVTEPIWSTLVAQGRYVHEQLVETWQASAPDVIVTDNVSAFPSILTAGVPWVRAVSCNELELADPALPPVFSGLPAGADAGWETFRDEYRRVVEPTWREFADFCAERGAPALSPLEFQYASPYLNLFLYPREVAYGSRARPLDASWHRLDSTVRAPDRSFDVAEHLPGDGACVYVSLGSLGCMDVTLMQRIVDELDRTPHRVIVSLGPLAAQIRLGERMYGEEFLPQTAILGQCDALITHAGNNTFCEAFHFGLPMIALPLFWDQYDNAQRADETGFGVRLETYAWRDGELAAAVSRLLADTAVRERLAAISDRVQAAEGRALGASLIERLVRSARPAPA